MSYGNVTVIIPSLNPDEKLLNTIKDLEQSGFDDIVVVNDGSGAEYLGIFETISKNPICTVLTHEVNKGKGAALKTALNFFSKNRSGRDGVVTIDADGQHLIKDIIACVEQMKSTGAVVLGCRDFSLASVPSRSRFGNRTTSLVFLLLCGLKISDTQTGLRAIPAEYIPELIPVKGDRYEYETNMLLEFKKQCIPYSECDIDTVYIDDNSSSHFRPIVDSLRIYRLILVYCLSAAISTVTDLVLFFLLSKFVFSGSGAVIWSTALARAVSSAVNFSINRRAVFGGRCNVATSLLKYAVLAVPIMLTSAFSVKLLEYLLGVHSKLLLTLIKMAVDTLLFFVNFRFQQNWVFVSKRHVSGKNGGRKKV